MSNLQEVWDRRTWFLIVLFFLIIGGVADFVRYARVPLRFKTEYMPSAVNPKVTEARQLLYYPDRFFVLTIISTIGYTFASSAFVSIFFISILDGSRAKRDQKEIQRDVFLAVYGTLMPPETHEAVRDQIIRNRLYRRDANLNYTFTKNDHTNGISLLKAFTYELHNSSIAWEKTHIRLFATAADGSTQTVINARCLDLSGVVLARWERNDDGSEEKENIVAMESSDEEVMSVEVPPQSHINVSIITISEYTKSHVELGITGVYFTDLPVIGAELNAYLPDKSYRFEVAGTFLGKLSVREQHGTEAARRYKIYGGILPHQGYAYRFQLRSTQQSNDT